MFGILDTIQWIHLLLFFLFHYTSFQRNRLMENLFEVGVLQNRNLLEFVLSLNDF